jgi:hypothetical protein
MPYASRFADRRGLLVVLALLLAVPLAGAQGVEEGATTSTMTTDVLPVSRVVLFRSGVAYYQHDGTVEGTVEAQLTFTAREMDDLLQSVVVQDLDGGRVETVAYPSRDPLVKALSLFSLNLADNPSFPDLVGQAVGEDVEVISSRTYRGSVVSVTYRIVVHEGESRRVPYLALHTDTGLTSINLQRIQSLRFLAPEVDAELRAALSLIREKRNAEAKPVSFRFAGDGRRRIRVAYIREAPVFKTTYRLVLSPEEDEAFLQGWAIVENTSPSDWRNVQVSLVAGSPVSFVANLYEPIYVDRPTVELDHGVSVSPKSYDQAMARERAAAPSAASGAAPRAAVPEPAFQRALDVAEGVDTAAGARELGAFFEYRIHFPVSARRQQSLMLPIAQETVAVTRLSLYDASVVQEHPLHAVELVNDTDLYLVAGPATVFAADAYAGDALLDDLSPGGMQLLTYAVDTEMEVATSRSDEPERIVGVQIRRGTLITSTRLRKRATYTAANRSGEPRLLRIVHPRSDRFELVQPAAPTERTRDSYRFALTVPAEADGPTTLEVVEERVQDQRIAVANLTPERIAVYLEARHIPSEVRESLEYVAELKSRITEMRRRIEGLERRRRTIFADQERIRENMKALEPDAALYKRYLGTLNQQESELAELQEQLADARERLESLERQLDSYIAELDV